MNTKTAYTIAYRNTRMSRVNGAHIMSDQHNLRFNNKSTFVKVESTIQNSANESMNNNFEPKGNSRYRAMVAEYNRCKGNTAQWLKMKAYFKLI